MSGSSSSSSPTTDRFDVSRTTRAPAAVEWRTIPPTINVRYKRRPPPLSLLARRPSDVALVSPGPLDTSAASPFSPYSPLSAPSTRRSSTSQWPWSATLSTFSEADTRLDRSRNPEPSFGTSDVRIEAPDDPVRYLSEHPWSFPEYLHLTSIVRSLHPSTLDGWSNVAESHGSSYSSSLGLTTYRSVWDCWHRASVPWVADSRDGGGGGHAGGSADTYPGAAGVQRRYRCIDVGLLIDMYLTATSVLGVADLPSFAHLESSAVDHSDRTIRRCYHPAYPSGRDPPHVPKRTLGDVAHRGILPWFRATAINTTVLRIRSVISAGAHETSTGLNDESGRLEDETNVSGMMSGTSVRLPAHLRRMRVPPPPSWRVRG